MNLWRRTVIGIAHIATWLARAFGFNGTALPGLIVERLSPGMLSELAGQLPGGIIVVTGTNGKTTTAKIIRHLLEARGLKVLANRSGSNFTRGIIASFVQHTGFDGKVRFDLAVLEIDEAYTPQLSKQLKPRQLVALNVMRDQLDRYGEIDNTAYMIGSALQYSQAAVLNADDPPVAGLHTYIPDEAPISYFGAAAAIRKLLPSDDELIGSKSKTDKRSKADIVLKKLSESGKASTELVIRAGSKDFSADFSLEGVHNALNATAAIASINQLYGVGVDDFKTLASVRPAFGRGERLAIDGVPVHLALIKNPGGFNQNVRSFTRPHVGQFLIAINDRYADGRDVSWLWDVDLSSLPRDGYYITSGVRAYDMALRLQYEGIDIENIKVDTSLGRAIKKAIASTPDDSELLVLPTYTAMLEIRRTLSRKTKTHEIWH